MSNFDEFSNDNPYDDGDMISEDEEFNSSQVPVDTITRKDVEKMIEGIEKKLPQLQKPFQPGASDTDEEKRFLCWNNTGIIRAQFGKGDDQNIDVMFHDTEKHTSVNFTNDPNFTFGSISDDAIVLGSNGKFGTGGSMIRGINLLESNPDKRDWDVELPHVELIEALAVGQGFIAVATNRKNLRLFTSGGMQSFILTLPGQILCMTASERQLLIIYHNGAGLESGPNLSMLVYHIDLLQVRIELLVDGAPVAVGKRLLWAGFSDEGTPCTYDYEGMLRIFRKDLGKAWVPVLDLKGLTKSIHDHYFVVGVCEITQTVRAVKCYKSQYPDFMTETAQLLDFRLPMCNMDTDRGQLEEEQVRLRLANLTHQQLEHLDIYNGLTKNKKEAREKQLVNAILRLFAMYLREDKEEVAKNLVYMMPKDHVSKLPEYAWKTKRRQHFIDSLNTAIDDREQKISSLDVSDFSLSKEHSADGTYKM